MPELNGTATAPVGSPEWCAWAADKIEGLTADLRLAVGVAYRRGAMDWARRNYPLWAAHLDEEMKVSVSDEGTRPA